MSARAFALFCTIGCAAFGVACSGGAAPSASMFGPQDSTAGRPTSSSAGAGSSAIGVVASQAGVSGSAGSPLAGRSAAGADSAGPDSASAGQGGNQTGNAALDAGRPLDDLDSGAPPVPSDAGVGADSGTPPKTVTCPTTHASSGETRGTLQHDGRTREYLTYIPNGYDPARPWPLVLNFHGATMTAEQQRDFSGMNAAADAKGFVVVYPQGVGNSWNAGVCCGEAQSSNVDDVGFARELIAAVQTSVCIDPDRVYSSGFSNGGRMTYRLGCELTDTFAALASVAGTKSFPDDQNTPGCKPTKPISMIDFMGSADPRSAAQPGQIAEWIAFNGCTDAMPMESYRQGQHVCTTYSQCSDATSVTACTVDGGDHCWPGSYPCLLGNTSRPEELSANELIWKLFERSVR